MLGDEHQEMHHDGGQAADAGYDVVELEVRLICLCCIVFLNLIDLCLNKGQEV